MRLRKADTPQAAPGWVVTYADFVTVLLCLFIALVSMSDIKKDRFQKAVESLQGAFGGVTRSASAAETSLADGNSRSVLIQRLSELATSGATIRRAASDAEESQGEEFTVANLRDGLRIVIGGRIAFDRFDAELKPEARELVSGTAQRLRGYRTKIVVRGHATNEPLPPDAPYRDPRDLSYARAKAVALALEKDGVAAARIIVVAAGDAEPLVQRAFTEEIRALNRRVEILVAEDLADE